MKKYSQEWMRKETKRLEALIYYEVLDTSSEEDLDSITHLASKICKTPISCISLIDNKRVWFKSRVGLDVTEIPKDISFCNYTIEEEKLVIVNNALEDVRFKNSPLVLSDPNIRFYAGKQLTTPNGYNIGTLCVIDTVPRDITKEQEDSLDILSKNVIKHMELKIKNKNLNTANEYAEKLSKIKDEFLSNMSHELRTPLNAILGFTEILSKTPLNSEQREMVQIVQASGEVLITLINDILDLSKIESGKLLIEKFPFDLKQTILNVQSLLKPKCIAKGVDFKVNFNFDESKRIILIGDKVRLSQIIINLVGNAIKFTSKGYVAITIQNLESSDKGINLRFSIQDTGIGIPENMIDKVFERFEQASTDTNRKFGGTGLGLSISKSLVELQGGQLKIKSEVGKGSEFFFELTFPKPTNSDLEIFFKEYEENKHNYNFQGTKVLVCEDSPVNIKLISKILKDEKINFQIAENGKIGADILKEDKTFDIVFMDLQMPEMNGFETTKYIREELKLKLPIIAMTANNSESEKKECLKIGMNDYISKPFKLTELFNKMALFLKKKSDGEKNPPVDSFLGLNSKLPKTRSIKNINFQNKNNKPKKNDLNLSNKNLPPIKQTNLFKIKPFPNSEIEINKIPLKKRLDRKNNYASQAVITENNPSTNKSQIKDKAKNFIFDKVDTTVLKEMSEDDKEFEKDMISCFLKNKDKAKNFIFDKVDTTVLKEMSEDDKEFEKDMKNFIFDKVDTTVLKEMSEDDKEFEKDMIGCFLKNNPIELLKLDEEIKKEDFNKIKFVAHTMKSSVALFGLKSIKAKLEEIEKISFTSKDIRKISENYQEIVLGLEKNYKDIQNLYDSYKD